jgi:hypothetical protein
MFIRPESGALAVGDALPQHDSLTVYFKGRSMVARAGDSVAAALLAGGVTVTRNTPVGGAPRGPYCMMGACFECLAVVDGRPNVQTCMTDVREGMRVECQDGARGLVVEGSAAAGLNPSPPPPPSRGGGE